MNDFDLLRAYVEQGAEDAFTELVNLDVIKLTANEK
jgi:hypothetical protein